MKNKLNIIASSVIALSISSFASAENIASDAGKTSDLYRNSIQTQLDREVDLRDSSSGINVFADQGIVSGGNMFSMGVQGAYRFYDQVTVGGAIQMPVNTDLSGSYSAKGTSNPNFSAYTKYQENKDGSGINAKLSGAYGYQKLGVKPFEKTVDSKFYGYGFRAEAGYGLNYGKALITPYTAVEYTNTKQKSFTSDDVFFSEMSEERTSMQFGVSGIYAVNSMVRFDADFGVNANIKTHRHDMTAEYQGYTYTSSYGNDKLQPYFGIGMTADIDRNSSVRVSGDVNRQSYDNTAGTVGVAYQYRF